MDILFFIFDLIQFCELQIVNCIAIGQSVIFKFSKQCTSNISMVVIRTMEGISSFNTGFKHSRNWRFVSSSDPIESMVNVDQFQKHFAFLKNFNIHLSFAINLTLRPRRKNSIGVCIQLERLRQTCFVPTSTE